MDHATHNKIASFIWTIANDCMRDVFVRGKYRNVILPILVLKRIDCLLEGTKEEVRFQKKEAKMTVRDPEGLKDVAKQVSYKTSKFFLKTLLGNPFQLVTKLPHYLESSATTSARLSPSSVFPHRSPSCTGSMPSLVCRRPSLVPPLVE
ncbi:MAG: type I restriction-modification system subunit M N-terminal domain-containing protein [Nitrospira sp.]|nr:type I restriction-modification system subunit M N-terminal domain-containing protein [Nitrospira sp.]